VCSLTSVNACYLSLVLAVNLSRVDLTCHLLAASSDVILAGKASPIVSSMSPRIPGNSSHTSPGIFVLTSLEGYCRTCTCHLLRKPVLGCAEHRPLRKALGHGTAPLHVTASGLPSAPCPGPRLSVLGFASQKFRAGLKQRDSLGN
jgi:hypothetical protein